MPLEFHEALTVDPTMRGVRFAGHPPTSQEGIIVVCEMTVDALQNLGGLTDPKLEELMGVFEIYKEMIFQVASAKFDEGAYRPRITSHDLEYFTV